MSWIERKVVEMVPENAYREAVANALIHRDWSIHAHIRIAMFPDRIEIKSPGSLPKGLTAEEYENGEISCLRNPILGNIFFRMKYIEMFGTGVPRIKYAYANARIVIRQIKNVFDSHFILGHLKDVFCRQSVCFMPLGQIIYW